MQIKSFLGIDLKNSVVKKIILWIHFVENFLLFLITTFQSHIAGSNQEFILEVNGSKIGLYFFINFNLIVINHIYIF